MMAVFTVTNLTDGPVNSAGDLPGSLRQAIFDSNSLAGPDTIEFSGIGSSGTITLTNGRFNVTDALIIDGPGNQASSPLVIDANGNSRLFLIDDGSSSNQADVTINGLGLSGGNTDFDGGAIFSREHLTITESRITGNTATLRGGAILNAQNAIVEITNTTIDNNSAGEGGGGVFNSVFGMLTVQQSELRDNTSLGDGGAIFNDANDMILSSSGVSSNQAVRGGGLFNQGEAEVTQSTFSGNTALNVGGGAYNTGTLTMTNSTVSGNSAVGNAGGIRTNSTSTLNAYHSTFAGNQSAANASTEEVMTSGTTRFENSIFEGNVFGVITDANFNLFGNNESFTNGTGNLESTDPMLGPLQDNGGPTLTHALVEASPAINAGDPAATPSSSDQRGSGFDRVIGGFVDIGAIEANPPVVRTLGSIPAGASTEPALTIRQGENLFYRFEIGDIAAANGEWLVIDTFGSDLTDGGAGPNDTEIALYDSAGNRIAQNDDFGSGRESQLAFGAPPQGTTQGDLAAGTYYLALGAWNTTFAPTGWGASSTSVAEGTIVVNFSTKPVCTVAGDLDCSGQVGAADLDLVLNHWGVDTSVAGVPSGWVHDLPNGVISAEELDNVLNNWGNSSLIPVPAATPMPASVENEAHPIPSADMVESTRPMNRTSDHELQDDEEDTKRYARQVDDLFATLN